MQPKKFTLSLLACVLAWSPCAHALRPFEGTDASVAEPGTFELELGPVGYIRNGDERTLVAPAVVGNWGIGYDTEIVLEGRANLTMGDNPERYRTSIGDTAISLKHVWRKGSMQGEAGLGVATECGVLLPGFHDEDGTGGVCSAIASHQLDAGELHLNAALMRTRAHSTKRFLGAILEAPEAWPVRPVMEIFTEHGNDGTRSRSLLVGAIWKHSEDLAFDAGVRRAREDGQQVNELRVGLTWSFSRR